MDGTERRLQRLEEAIGFAEHDAAGLAEMVRELSVALAALVKRVEGLERRLEAISRGPASLEPGDSADDVS